MSTATSAKIKPYKGMGMEGPIASWYAKTTATSMPAFRALAERIARQVGPGGAVLEIAPGPGYFAIELAKLGSRRIVGLDISRSFVRIAAENAAKAGVDVTFLQGDAAALPFQANEFDVVVCRAAFKNFGDPVGAMAQMHRVLRPGGTAVIIDMRADATDASIRDEVGKMKLGGVSAFMTKAALTSLKKRAYSREAFLRMAAATPFGHAEITAEPLGFEVRLVKSA